MMNTSTVLITDALNGIGRATALAFAREGARIVVSGRHDDKGKALVSELQALGAGGAFIKSDVRHEDEVRALSTYGRAGAPGAALYVASKHAVEGFTKAAALEYAESGVRINVVAPSTTETDLTRRPPRSMRVRLGGFGILARTLDKGRATLAKKNGEFNYNSPTVARTPDQRWHLH